MSVAPSFLGSYEEFKEEDFAGNSVYSGGDDWENVSEAGQAVQATFSYLKCRDPLPITTKALEAIYTFTIGVWDAENPDVRGEGRIHLDSTKCRLLIAVIVDGQALNWEALKEWGRPLISSVKPDGKPQIPFKPETNCGLFDVFTSRVRFLHDLPLGFLSLSQACIPKSATIRSDWPLFFAAMYTALRTGEVGPMLSPVLSYVVPLKLPKATAMARPTRITIKRGDTSPPRTITSLSEYMEFMGGKKRIDEGDGHPPPKKRSNVVDSGTGVFVLKL